MCQLDLLEWSQGTILRLVSVPESAENTYCDPGSCRTSLRSSQCDSASETARFSQGSATTRHKNLLQCELANDTWLRHQLPHAGSLYLWLAWLAFSSNAFCFVSLPGVALSSLQDELCGQLDLMISASRWHRGSPTTPISTSWRAGLGACG